MESNNNLWEYKEFINRLQATPQEVEKVKQQIEYSNRLVKAHNVMKVLDLPDNQDSPIRKILLKEDDTTLEELANKSKDEIREFLLNNRKKELTIENTINNEKFNHLKSAFPQSILDKNPEIATMLEKRDFDGLLSFLKSWNNLKSITDQLWWAKEGNPKYQEFKANLIAVDSGFSTYFDEIEKVNSKNTPSNEKIAKQVEKESDGIVSIDLNSKTPISKMSLIWSEYSFDEEIDKKALDKITTENRIKLDEIQSSITTLKGLYKPFDSIVTVAKQNLWKENLKEKLNESVSKFSRTIFSEADEMYEKMGIKSDIQIKESDITSLANATNEDDLKQKIVNIEEKFEKIKTHIQDIKTTIEAKHQNDVKGLLAMKSEQKEKQVEVLKFMNSCGFDLIPKEISDKFIRDIQAHTLQIPWLDLDTKNINLKNGNFWESVLYKDDGLNIHSKTNMVKFMNKLISWDINQPLKVESIVNGTEKVNPSFLQNKFLETWIVDSLWWREWKISENLGKVNKESIKS